jgi:membrane protein implicated in regulation of membrane protease activity
VITCPWCGTNYAAFQSNCKNCGGPLPHPAESTPAASAASGSDVVMPPPPPRVIADSYAWRLLLADGWAITASIFALLGAIFFPLGAILTIGIVTAFVGIPFAGLGFVFLSLAIAALVWRYQEAQKVLTVLRTGEATRGQIVSVQQNYNVQINGRNPWSLVYQFRANGRDIQGRVTTLNYPGPQLRPGSPACVLYLSNAPDYNSLYPHP